MTVVCLKCKSLVWCFIDGLLSQEAKVCGSASLGMASTRMHDRDTQAFTPGRFQTPCSGDEKPQHLTASIC